MLLVCKYDRIRKKLTLKYRIPSKDIKLIENSNESNELMFRIVSSDQNNEFKVEYVLVRHLNSRLTYIKLSKPITKCI